jgi:hypothetical protein
MGGEDTKVGAAEVRVLLENEPVVSVKSTVKEANFTFGRRQAAGEDHSQNDSYCSYVFDESMPEQRVVKYFCSDLNERSWMNNTYSSISISNRTGKINRICKEAEYRNAALSAARCWKLSNCK